MNKQELQKKYEEIILNTNGTMEDYSLAICLIGNAIDKLDEPKQDTKWQKLKEWASYLCYFELVDKMQELEKGEQDVKS